MQLKHHTAIAALMAAFMATGAVAQSANASATGSANATDNSGVAAGAGSEMGQSMDGTEPKQTYGLGSGTSQTASDTGGASMSDGADNGMGMASAEGVKSYGDLVSSLRSDQTANADLSGFAEGDEMTVARLSALQGEAADNAEGLDQAIAENQDKVDEMRDSIAANADLVAALDAEGFTADQVVAVDESGGALTVYVDDTI
ncbi:hypothetical protein GLS40_04935 [Pseudooceanicola sp. 216_PA32_1]|uniref:Uncharacterized protein n=1 Tax=Pseudooceanicola pacificus TaxID=2676438 RepID=A0A844W956_9RHOB|nr:hypothetical protein [Pseudooceanicola pacificus]MWB77363.1 hypothetical protein [Pseudooceanicola pacificus]